MSIDKLHTKCNSLFALLMILLLISTILLVNLDQLMISLLSYTACIVILIRLFIVSYQYDKLANSVDSSSQYNIGE